MCWLLSVYLSHHVIRDDLIILEKASKTIFTTTISYLETVDEELSSHLQVFCLLRWREGRQASTNSLFAVVKDRIFFYVEISLCYHALKEVVY